MIPSLAPPPVRLARALGRRLAPRLAHLDGEQLATAVDLVQRFAQQPTALAYLQVDRELARLLRDELTASVTGLGVHRAFSEGLRLLAEVPQLPREFLEELAAYLPVEPGAGERLGAVAALATAHAELLRRVHAEEQRRRAELRISRAGRRRRSAPTPG